MTGIVTARDSLVIDMSKDKLIERMKNFSNSFFNDDYVRNLYFGNKKSGKYLAGDSRGWSLISARKKIEHFDHQIIIKKLIIDLLIQDIFITHLRWLIGVEKNI
ncbi:hypothetical protein [Flavobacterium piscinae]|uniref:hypothetical protein n=1 Tax=Flavobacterium piscinae TaxID=2506424 RepID=UPI002AAB7FBB|nr:hypothetical protein [Flavobacterium piscinae]